MLNEEGLEDEEGEEMKERERGEELDVPLEDFPPLLADVTFENLTNLIPKLEKGIRIKVFRQNGKLHPLSNTGWAMVRAYRKVGFSYVPVEVVAEPPPKEKKVKEKELIPKYREMFAQMDALIEAPQRVWRELEAPFLGEEQAQRLRNAMIGGQQRRVPQRRPIVEPGIEAPPPPLNWQHLELNRLERIAEERLRRAEAERIEGEV